MAYNYIFHDTMHEENTPFKKQIFIKIELHKNNTLKKELSKKKNLK